VSEGFGEGVFFVLFGVVVDLVCGDLFEWVVDYVD